MFVDILDSKNKALKTLHTKSDFYIRVHATWCGACKNMQARIDKMKKNKNIIVVDIEETALKHFKADHKTSIFMKKLPVIKYYPTIIHHTPGGEMHVIDSSEFFKTYENSQKNVGNRIR